MRPLGHHHTKPYAPTGGSPWGRNRHVPRDASLVQSYEADTAERLRRAVVSTSQYNAVDRPVWFRCGSWGEITAMARQVCRGYQSTRKQNAWRKRRFKFELLGPA
jgi:hypothetical protein